MFSGPCFPILGDVEKVNRVKVSYIGAEGSKLINCLL